MDSESSLWVFAIEEKSSCSIANNEYINQHISLRTPLTLALRLLQLAIKKSDEKLSQEENFKSSGEKANECAIYIPNEMHTKANWQEAKSARRKAAHEKKETM